MLQPIKKKKNGSGLESYVLYFFRVSLGLFLCHPGYANHGEHEVVNHKGCKVDCTQSKLEQVPSQTCPLLDWKEMECHVDLWRRLGDVIVTLFVKELREYQ